MVSEDVSMSRIVTCEVSSREANVSLTYSYTDQFF